MSWGEELDSKIEKPIVSNTAPVQPAITPPNSESWGSALDNTTLEVDNNTGEKIEEVDNAQEALYSFTPVAYDPEEELTV